MRNLAGTPPSVHSPIRDQDARQLSVRAVQHGHVADAVHERAARIPRERGEQRVTGRAVPAWNLHLDELVILERARGLSKHRGRESRIAETNYRLQRVGEPAKVLALAFGELWACRSAGEVRDVLHRGIVEVELMPGSGAPP